MKVLVAPAALGFLPFRGYFTAFPANPSVIRLYPTLSGFIRLNPAQSGLVALKTHE